MLVVLHSLDEEVGLLFRRGCLNSVAKVHDVTLGAVGRKAMAVQRMLRGRVESMCRQQRRMRIFSVSCTRDGAQGSRMTLRCSSRLVRF